MKKLALALVAFAFAAPSAAAAQDVAPAVKRKPAATTPAPAAPRQAAPASASAQPAPQQSAGRSANERDVQAALTAAAAQGGTASALDTSLIRVMSRLVAAGRCGEAVGLASRDGRKELASRAQQLCK